MPTCAELAALLELQTNAPISDALAADVVTLLTTQLHPRLRLDYGLLEIERRLEFMSKLMLLDARGDHETAITTAEELREAATLITAFPHMTSVAQPRRDHISRTD